jgi:hypothetical protein
MTQTWVCKHCDGIRITPDGNPKTSIRQGTFVTTHDGVICTECTSGTKLIWMTPLPKKDRTP